MTGTSTGGTRVFGRLVRYARPFAGVLVLSVVFAGLASGGRYVRAYLVKPLLDDVVMPHQALLADGGPSGWLRDPGAPAPPDAPALSESERAEVLASAGRSLGRLAAIAALVIVGLPLLLFGRAYSLAWVLGRVHADMQRALCARLLVLPLGYHQNARRGDLLTRILRDVRISQESLQILFGDLVQSVLMVAVGVVVLALISWQLALVTCAVTPLIVLVTAFFRRRIRATARRRQETFGDVTQRLIEILAGIKVVKAFRAEGLEQRAFERETAKLFRRSMKATKSRVMARSLSEMLNHGVAVGVLVLGTALVLRGRWGLSIGDLAAFGAVMSTSYGPIKNLAKGWVTLVDAEASAQRFYEVMDAPAEAPDADDAQPVDDVRRSIRFDRVRFSYGREPVLRDVSFEVRAGEVVAIVGRTGAGKTTISDLLLRFYDPDAGAVEIDGVDLRRIRRESWLSRVAVVTQEPFLFDASIRENIRYGRPGASDGEVLAAARVAHVDEFVARLPEGMDTEVGALGMRLSGGQRQRVTIARAVLRDPSVLVCDEATSALDRRSEAYVQDAIDSLLRGRTVFLIAHRASTIRRADRILVLDHGRVAQFGTHAELDRSSSLYRELVSSPAPVRATTGAPPPVN